MIKKNPTWKIVLAFLLAFGLWSFTLFNTGLFGSGDRLESFDLLYFIIALACCIPIFLLGAVRVELGKKTYIAVSITAYVFAIVGAMAVSILFCDGFLSTPYIFIVNTAFYLIVAALALVASGSMRVSALAALVVSYIFNVAIFIIYCFRGTALSTTDIYGVGTAMNVAAQYSFMLKYQIITATIVTIALAMLVCKFPIRIKKFRLRPLVMRLAGAVTAAACAAFILSVNVNDFDISAFDQYYANLNYGSAFGFYANATKMGLQKHDTYDTEYLNYLLSAYEQDRTVPADKPNVVVIMNESFSDLSVLGDLKTNDDYMPFFHSLNSENANVIKGKLYVDVFGGGTCNSEYSFLTGNTTAFLPENTRPFQLYVDHNTPSLAKTLKAQGYETSGLHPGEAANWNRNTVYPALGIDHAYFYEDSFIGEHFVRDFMGDDATYRKVIDIYEKGKDKPQFIFDVTIAGHGGYDMGGTETLAHQIRGQDNLSGLPTLDEYLTVLRECDGALQVLIDYFEKQEDPVVIVFFGDHQPKLENDFYDRIKNKPKSEWNAEDNLSMQVTPYLIWSNYDFEGQAEDEDISVNFLQQKVLRAAGLETTAYDNYEAALVKDYPIVSVKGIVDKDGNYQNVRDAKKEDRQIADYQQVVYNNMIDAKNRVTDLFTIETQQTH